MTTPERAPSPERAALDRTQVVQAAIALIDQEGIGALTMRRLATALGVFPTTLYWHAGNKDQLMALVYQEVLAEIDIPPVGSLPWERWIVSLARNARAALAHHPDIAAMFVTQIQVSSASMELVDAMVATLEGAGFAGERLLYAYTTVTGSIFGWISSEYASTSGEIDNDWQASFRAGLDLDETLEAYPAVRRNVAVLRNSAWMVRWESGRTKPMRRQFEAMLQIVLNGLKADLVEHDDGRAH